ncbi:MAG: hypothetical protein QOI53_345 [Verrucomicrobiota bacterium]|jgi:hypothetical protein|nr:hypothetical protein [Verrucomicrobiota bacterium]
MGLAFGVDERTYLCIRTVAGNIGCAHADILSCNIFSFPELRVLCVTVVKNSPPCPPPPLRSLSLYNVAFSDSFPFLALTWRNWQTRTAQDRMG